MLMDVFSFGVGAFVGTIMGIGIMAMMVTGKQADEEIDDEIIKCPFVYDPETCHRDCDWIKRCNYWGIKV